MNSYLKDAKRLEEFIFCLGPSELVQIKISVAVSLVFLLEESKAVEEAGFLREALECLYENSFPNESLMKALPFVNSKIITYQRQASSMNNPVNKMIAAGLQVWLLSVRSLIRPELLPCARRVWGRIDGAEKVDFMAGISDISRFLGGHPIGETLGMNVGFEVPAVFVGT